MSNERINRRVDRAPQEAPKERKLPRLPGGFSLPPFGLHQSLALVIVCIALWSVGVLWLVLQAGSVWTQGWQKDVRFHVYLQQQDAQKLNKLATKLQALPGVASVRVVPQRESREWLADWLGDAAEMTDELMASLPGSVEVRPANGSDEFLYDDVADTAAAFGASVNRGEAHLVQAQHVMSKLQNLLWFGSLIMGLAMVTIISNTLRMILLARANEVQLMRLLGAKEWFVRLPFVLEGGLIGGMAGLLAWLLLWPLLLATGDWLVQLDVHISVFVLFLPLLFGGALAGLLGALLATTRIASENTATV